MVTNLISKRRGIFLGAVLLSVFLFWPVAQARGDDAQCDLARKISATA